MKFYTLKVISPEDGVVFLNWRTEARSSQNALSQFTVMLDGCLDSEFEIKGDFNVEIREVEREEIPEAA